VAELTFIICSLLLLPPISGRSPKRPLTRHYDKLDDPTGVTTRGVSQTPLFDPLSAQKVIICLITMWVTLHDTMAPFPAIELLNEARE